MHDGVIYMALSERNYPIKLANSYLEELHAGFQQVNWKKQSKPSYNFYFSRKWEIIMEHQSITDQRLKQLKNLIISWSLVRT